MESLRKATVEQALQVRGNIVGLALLFAMTGSGIASAQGIAPYCAVPVFEVPFHPAGGQATFDPFGRPVILVDPTIVARLPHPHGGNFVEFLLAHECVHHLERHFLDLMQAGMFGGYVLMQTSHAAEFEADCGAATILARMGRFDVIESAIWVFMNSNPFPSYSHPGGRARAQHIAQCAR